MREHAARGIVFESQATFRSDAHGNVDLVHDPARSGSYRGVFAMGLLFSMRPKHYGGPPATYLDLVTSKGQTVHLTATVEGDQVARASFVRRAYSPGVTVEDLRPGRVGFYGDLYRPPSQPARRPGLVLLGGSEGGLSLADRLEAGLFASHGYPTLALAYFGEQALPAALSDIRLEYFGTALRWLARQPGVDPQKLVLSGGSRGSEAALLVAAHMPGLVRAVIALVPSNVTLCGYPDCPKPAWLLHGKPLPYVDHFGPHSKNPAAVIPVEHINGPILMVCGGADDVWPSCPMAHAIADRRRSHHVGSHDILLDYPNADHNVGLLIPNLAYRTPGFDEQAKRADRKGRTRAWPVTLRFLATLTQQSR